MGENIRTYLLFNDLPKTIRSIITFILLILGLLIQIEVSIIIGSIFIIIASLLNVLRSAKIKERKILKSDWERVTSEEFYKVKDKIEQIKSWQGISIEVKIIFVIMAGVIIFIYIPKWITIAKEIANGELFPLIIINFIILFIPMILSGNKRAWIPKDLEIKINAILKIMDFAFLKEATDIRLQPYLLVGKILENKSLPLDAKLMIEFPKAPKDFIGIQIQASVNNVGNKSYPYVYAVIIAKQNLNLKMKELHSFDKKIIFEASKQDEMDILVIRQYTTKTSGYHTDDAAIVNIVKQSLEAAKKLLE